MNQETEIRILEIKQEEWIAKLEEIGAILEGNWLQKRKVYDFQPVIENKWIRLRTNGKTTTLAIKEITDENIANGTNELEIEVSNFEKTAQILEELGYHYRSLEENKRIRYRYNNIEIDIDTWPLIPTYVEIEAPTEKEITDFLKNFTFDKGKITTLGVQSIYEKVYQIPFDFKVLTFESQIK